MAQTKHQMMLSNRVTPNIVYFLWIYFPPSHILPGHSLARMFALLS